MTSSNLAQGSMCGCSIQHRKSDFLSLLNPSTDLAEIWPQFLAGKSRPSPNFGLGLLSSFKQ